MTISLKETDVPVPSGRDSELRGSTTSWMTAVVSLDSPGLSLHSVSFGREEDGDTVMITICDTNH